MTYDDIIQVFGPNITKAAASLGVTPATLFNYRKLQVQGKPINKRSQQFLQTASGGKLKVDNDKS